MMRNNQPKYLQVKNKIITQIASGIYPDGTLLSAEKELMEQFKVSRNTIRAALKELGKEQIILKQQGRPSIIQRKYIDNNSEKKPFKIAWLDSSRIGMELTVYFNIFQNIATLSTQKNIQLDYISLPMLNSEDMDNLDLSEYAGVITNGTALTSDMVKLFKKIPNLICIDHLVNIPASNYICTDNRKGGYLATKYLLQQGCKNIIFLGVAPSFFSYTPFGERLHGYQDALLESGIDPKSERIIISSEYNVFQNIGAFLESKMELLKNSDAIFAITDWIAVDTVFALQRLGFSIPSDISVIGFDGMAQSQFMHPKLTTMRQPIEKIAKTVFDYIMDSCFKNGSLEHLIQIEPDLLIGETVKKSHL
jgi:DNA-binding LacI/PurR family transcriptional regulator/DNA-binding transcriptional regulator YhcF (GntR family)